MQVGFFFFQGSDVGQRQACHPGNNHGIHTTLMYEQ